MTDTLIKAYGDTLLMATAACGLKMWTWDDAFDTWMRSSAIQAAFNHLAATAAAHVGRPCIKP